MKPKRIKKVLLILLGVMTLVVGVGIGIYHNIDMIIDQTSYQNKVDILLGDSATTSKKWAYVLGGEQEQTLLPLTRHTTSGVKDTNSEKEAGHSNGEKAGNPDTQNVPTIPPNPEREIDKPLEINPGAGTSPIIDLCTPVYAAKFRVLGKEFISQSKTFENYVILEHAKIDAPTYEKHQKYFETYRQIGENIILFADEIDKGNIDTALTYLDTLIALNESVAPVD